MRCCAAGVGCGQAQGEQVSYPALLRTRISLLGHPSGARRRAVLVLGEDAIRIDGIRPPLVVGREEITRVERKGATVAVNIGEAQIAFTTRAAPEVEAALRGDLALWRGRMRRRVVVALGAGTAAVLAAAVLAPSAGAAAASAAAITIGLAGWGGYKLA
jgi:hypothetical protein